MSADWRTASPHAGRLSHCQVLVVEDEPLIALELAALLTDAGAKVLGPASELPTALSLAARAEMDAALLDVRLGKHTIAPVAEILEQRGAPFAFYTGQVENDQVRLRWPHAPLIAKPASAADVVRVIERLCRTASDDRDAVA